MIDIYMGIITGLLIAVLIELLLIEKAIKNNRK